MNQCCHNALVAIWFVVSTVSCGPSQIVRIRAGQSYEERLIDSRAYAAFMRARVNEAKGDSSLAAHEYEQVLSFDPQAVEAWVRLGSIHCLRDPAKASSAWRTAEQLDPQSPELWLLRARCEYRQGHFERALDYARSAVRFEPLSAEAAVLVADVLSRLNRKEESVTWLRGASAILPTNVYLWSTIFRSENSPDFDRRYAALQLARLRPMDSSAIPLAYSFASRRDQALRSAWKINLEQALETAFRKSDTAGAERVATLLGINPEQLAMRALAEGSYKVALDEVAILLALDSSNVSAWIVGLLAADRCRDDVRFDSLLARPPRASIPSDVLYRDFLVELIGNRATLSAVNSD